MNDERRPAAPPAPITNLGENGNRERGDRLLTARELADVIGLSPGTVLDWWQAGRIPGFKLGGRVVRFSEREIAAWLAESHVEARA
jgi:excisionase family DNA binding protein